MASFDPHQTPLISETVLRKRRTLDELAYRRSSKYFYIYILFIFNILNMKYNNNIISYCRCTK